MTLASVVCVMEGVVEWFSDKFEQQIECLIILKEYSFLSPRKTLFFTPDLQMRWFFNVHIWCLIWKRAFPTERIQYIVQQKYEFTACNQGEKVNYGIRRYQYSELILLILHAEADNFHKIEAKEAFRERFNISKNPRSGYFPSTPLLAKSCKHNHKSLYIIPIYTFQSH